MAPVVTKLRRLSLSKNLKFIYVIGENLVGDAGATELSVQIKKPRTTQLTLLLDGNKIGNNGIKALGEAIDSFEKLSLSN